MAVCHDLLKKQNPETSLKNFNGRLSTGTRRSRGDKLSQSELSVIRVFW